MPFPLTEHNALLALKGVGPAVIARLEQMGIDSLAVLSKANACDILAQASAAVGSSLEEQPPSSGRHQRGHRACKGLSVGHT